MAADPPLNRLVLSAASVADDLGYVALADRGQALGEVTADYRIIGGHMVTMLATHLASARYSVVSGRTAAVACGTAVHGCQLWIPAVVWRVSGIIWPG